VSFAAITICVASQRVFIVGSVYFVTTQYGNFWIHPRNVAVTTTPFYNVITHVMVTEYSRLYSAIEHLSY